MKGFLSAAFVLFLLSASGQTNTEQKTKKLDADRLIVSGGFGAGFGDLTMLRIAPQLGYLVTPKTTIGGGIHFNYTNRKFRNWAGIETSRYNYGFAGVNVFARWFPSRFLFASVQPELSYSWGKIRYSTVTNSVTTLPGKFVPSMLVGMGWVFSGRGARGGMMMSLQYDLAQDPRSPYPNIPFLQFGFQL